MNKDWLVLLQNAVSKSTMTEVADKLGYSVATVCLVLSGKYPGKTDKVAKKVVEVFAVVSCPFLQADITSKECVGFGNCKAPTHNPNKMQHWRFCQRCPNKQEA